MATTQPTVTYLELRESNADGSAAAGLSHTGKGLVLLHVQELAADGEPRGAVTIVHDAGGHGGLFLRLGRRLAESGWAVALPDLRGHGRSEGARGHTNGVLEVARDLGDVQDHLAYRQPDAPKVLVGQGLGALWCLAYASERPDGIAALVLAAPLLDPNFDLPQATGGLLKLFKKVGPDAPGRIGWNPAERSNDPEVRAALAAEPAHDVITLRAGEEARAAAQKYVPKLGQLAMPVLVLVGVDDRIAPASRVRVLSGPRVEVREFAGVHHDLFLDGRAGDVSEAVVRWLDAKLPR
ncbi:MAG: alpha/beta fold hydrolase [Planctomycetota bacterium]|nr:alpha/beta fold hydrolase [Planctomycetota bacterium]